MSVNSLSVLAQNQSWAVLGEVGVRWITYGILCEKLISSFYLQLVNYYVYFTSLI